MELAVVGVDGRRTRWRHGMESVVARLAVLRCAEAVSTEPHSRDSHLIAELLGINARTVAEIDFGSLIHDGTGKSVAVLSDAGSVRELVADVMNVSEGALPLPQPLSLTVVRASRSGVRSVLCLNDTLHLTIGERTRGAVEGV